MHDKSIGSRLHAWRLERGLTLLEVARAADVHVSTVSAWELGKASPSALSMGRLATNLGADLEALIVGGPTGQAARFDWDLLFEIESALDAWTQEKRILITAERRRALVQDLYALAIRSERSEQQATVRAALRLVA